MAQGKSTPVKKGETGGRGGVRSSDITSTEILERWWCISGDKADTHDVEFEVTGSAAQETTSCWPRQN